jgi:hypothetical protein
MAFAISMTCLWATLRSPTRLWREMPGSRLASTASTASMAFASRWKKPARTFSLPRMRFSSTVSWSTTFSSWNSTLMPEFMASRVLRGTNSFPLKRIVPPLRRWAPVRILISVDLPAPFSPTMQWTVFLSMSKDTSRRASTPGNRLVMFRISSSFSGMGASLSPPAT